MNSNWFVKQSRAAAIPAALDRCACAVLKQSAVTRDPPSRAGSRAVHGEIPNSFMQTALSHISSDDIKAFIKEHDAELKTKPE